MNPIPENTPPNLIDAGASESLGRIGDKKAQNIMFVTAEVAPYSKVGGLGDVMGAQPKALAALGRNVSVVSPYYGFVKNFHDDIEHVGSADVPWNGGMEPVDIYKKVDADGVSQVFVSHPYFDEEVVYTPDNATFSNEERFAFFSRASLVAAELCDIKPDIVQANDWHTAYVPTLMKESDESLLPEHFKDKDIPTILTVHNTGLPCFQGRADLTDTIKQLRLPEDIAEKTHFQFDEQSNALWSGIGNADIVNTVSPSYAEEICNPANQVAGSLPLEKFNDGTFATDKIIGITNGIDGKMWNPQSNPAPNAFSPDDLSGKAACKESLCDTLGLATDRPLMSCITRMSDQKGVDVLKDSIEELVGQGWNLYIGGHDDSVAQAKVQEEMKEIADKYPDNIVFENRWIKEHEGPQIMAGSDVKIVCSRYEPCGLTQMQALAYGTLPLVSDTGGLHDTVDEGVTGFKFAPPASSHDEESLATAKANLLEGAQRAIDTYHNDPDKWQEMQKNAMCKDNSWEHAAGEYTRIYDELAQHAQQKAVTQR